MEKKIKLLIVGSPKIGKSDFVAGLTESFIDKRYRPTLGVDYHCLYHLDYGFKIYDAGGSTQLTSIVNQYYNYAHVVVLAFSLNDVDSLDRLNEYYYQAKKLNPRAHFLLLGLQEKTPSLDGKPIDQSLISAFMNKHGIALYCACDSKHSYGFNEFKKQAVYYFELTDKLHRVPRFSSDFEPLWNDKKCIIENIKSVFMDALGLYKHNIRIFNSSNNFKSSIRLLLQSYCNNNSLTAAKCLLCDLQFLSSENANQLQPQIQYIEDKLNLLSTKRALNINEWSYALK